MSKFEIEVCRVGYGFATIPVEANTLEEAETIALDEAGGHSFSEKTSEYSLTNASTPSPTDAIQHLKAVLAELNHLHESGDIRGNASRAATASVIQNAKDFLQSQGLEGRRKGVE